MYRNHHGPAKNWSLVWSAPIEIVGIDPSVQVTVKVVVYDPDDTVCVMAKLEIVRRPLTVRV